MDGVGVGLPAPGCLDCESAAGSGRQLLEQEVKWDRLLLSRDWPERSLPTGGRLLLDSASLCHPTLGTKSPRASGGEQVGRQAGEREGGLILQRAVAQVLETCWMGHHRRWTVKGGGGEGVRPCPQGSDPSWGWGSPGCRHGAAGTGSGVQADVGVVPQLHAQSEGSGGLR